PTRIRPSDPSGTDTATSSAESSVGSWLTRWGPSGVMMDQAQDVTVYPRVAQMSARVRCAFVTGADAPAVPVCDRDISGCDIFHPPGRMCRMSSMTAELVGKWNCFHRV